MTMFYSLFIWFLTDSLKEHERTGRREALDMSISAVSLSLIQPRTIFHEDEIRRSVQLEHPRVLWPVRISVCRHCFRCSRQVLVEVLAAIKNLTKIKIKYFLNNLSTKYRTAIKHNFDSRYKLENCRVSVR